VRTEWSAAFLVCGKCSKKIDGGFGEKGKTSLAKLLRKAAGKGKKRKAPYGVVETRCLGICPSRAVVVVDGAKPDEWLLIREGMPIEEIGERLGLAIPEESAKAGRGWRFPRLSIRG
jgi:predicted metal-binding protein